MMFVIPTEVEESRCLLSPASPFEQRCLDAARHNTNRGVDQCPSITTNSKCASAARDSTKSPMTCSQKSTRAECETEEGPFLVSTPVAASAPVKLPTL